MNLDNVEDIFALSPMQEGMLYHTISEPQSGVFVEQVCCEFRGELNVDIFTSSWKKIVQHHPALRTVFLWDGLDAPLQVVRETVDVPWQYFDWRNQSAKIQRDALADLLVVDRSNGFNLAEAPVTRMTLIRTADDQWRWLWSCHHILTDGWSTQIILKDLFATYAAGVQNQNHELQRSLPYRDYIQWLQSQDVDAAESFWREKLKGFYSPTRLRIVDDRNNQSRSGKHAQQTVSLSRELSEALREFAKQQRLTLNTILQGAWALLLSRCAGEDDIVYGTTVSGRPAAISNIENAVGMFINTLPVRVEASPDAQLSHWLRRLQEQLITIQAYEYSSLATVQSWSDIPPGEALFESIVVFENYPANSTDLQRVGINIENVEYFEQSNYPLALLVVPGNEFELLLVHDTVRYGPDACQTILQMLVTLLSSFVSGPQTRLGKFSVSKSAPSTVLKIARPDVIEMFEQQVKRQPDAVAVTFQNHQLTYNELNCQANAVATGLRAQGIVRNSRVGIYCSRSCEMMVAIWGILKSGAAYVPLDPDYPADHLRFVVDDAQIEIILAQPSLVGTVPSSNARVLAIERTAAVSVKKELPAITQDPDALAYVIYTSGSTGKPKGVAVSHGNLAWSTSTRADFYVDDVQQFLLLSSFAFDSSVAGIFWTLCGGGTLVLPPAGIEQDTAKLLKLISEQRITHALCLPSLYSIILKDALSDHLKTFRVVIVAGETCPPSLCAQHCNTNSNAKLFNEYGPTEATVWSTVYQLTATQSAGPVPIGRPLSDTVAAILDHHRQPVPQGVHGELFIGGEGIAKGYLNRQELTSERFVALQFDERPPVRMFRTGDLAVARADGNLLFLGRVDRQIKIRGYRIEPGEIEEHLTKDNAVSDAIVVAVRRHSPQATATNQCAGDITSLIEQLSELPQGRVASLLVAVEELSNAEVAAKLGMEPVL